MTPQNCAHAEHQQPAEPERFAAYSVDIALPHRNCANPRVVHFLDARKSNLQNVA
jgi:hypothetical protein